MNSFPVLYAAPTAIFLEFDGIARSVMEVFVRPVSSKTNTTRLTQSSSATIRRFQIRNLKN